MIITHANVGDVIRLDQGARYIQIEKVSDQHVEYLRETGHRHAVSGHEMKGSVVSDPARIEAFHANSELGIALVHAENSALFRLQDGSCSGQQREEAKSVLQYVKTMRKNLSVRLSRHRDCETKRSRPRASLDSLISKASSVSQSQSAPVTPGRSEKTER